MLRDLIVIDEAKCDGCGNCVTACAEGALAIVGGKAKLVSDVYCDGLGACLGHCPQGAITVVKRDVPAFDQKAVDVHLTRIGRAPGAHAAPSPAPTACGCDHGEPAAQPAPTGPSPISIMSRPAGHACPGSQMRSLGPRAAPAMAKPTGGSPQQPAARVSQLSHWPIQLALLNPAAPFLRGADLLLTAHCVPVAMPDFHQRWVGGHGVMLACPKLDDLARHTAKLAAILSEGQPASLTVLKMEVPCCGGLEWSAKQAIEQSGWRGRLEIITVPIAA